MKNRILRSMPILPSATKTDLSEMTTMRHSMNMVVGLMMFALIMTTWLMPFAKADEASQRRTKLRANISHYPVLTPNTQLKGVSFVPLTLNKKPIRIGALWYDAFTFRTPAKNVPDFHWAFTRLPKNVEVADWNILPEKGIIPGSSANRVNYSVLGDDFITRIKPTEKEKFSEGSQYIFFEKLESKNLRPNTRYIVWFAFKNKQPAYFRVSLNLMNFSVKPLFDKTRKEIRARLGDPVYYAGAQDIYIKFRIFGIHEISIDYVYKDEAYDMNAKSYRVSPVFIDPHFDWRYSLKAAGFPLNNVQPQKDPEEGGMYILEGVQGVPQNWRTSFYLTTTVYTPIIGEEKKLPVIHFTDLVEFNK